MVFQYHVSILIMMSILSTLLPWRFIHVLSYAKLKTVVIINKKFSWSANSLLRLIDDNLSARTNIIQQQSSTHTHHHAPLTATIRLLALACAQPYGIKLTCSFIHSYYILFPFKKRMIILYLIKLTQCTLTDLLIKIIMLNIVD